jgi:hypothetical protein
MYMCREPGKNTVSTKPIYIMMIKKPVRTVEGAKRAERHASTRSARKAAIYLARGGGVPAATSQARHIIGKRLATRADTTSTRRIYAAPYPIRSPAIPAATSLSAGFGNAFVVSMTLLQV